MSDAQANRLLDDACTTIENFAWSYDHPGLPERARLAGLLTGLSFSAVVRHLGWWAALRILFGAVLVAIRYPNVVDLREPA